MKVFTNSRQGAMGRSPVAPRVLIGEIAMTEDGIRVPPATIPVWPREAQAHAAGQGHAGWTSEDCCGEVALTPIGETTLKEISMHIIWTIIIGFIAGVIAKFVTPGDNEPSGFVLTTILGIIGAFVATYLGQAIGWYRADEGAGLNRSGGGISNCPTDLGLHCWPPPPVLREAPIPR
jgi:uncharacterized membrane protein YeaQ/YmgE (transglycosylase-associated protein family)